MEDEFDDVGSDGFDNSEHDDDAVSRIGSDDIDGEDGDDDAEADFDTFNMFANLSKADLINLPVEEWLQKWHNTVLPMEVDLVTELDASSLFFIHAEALIYDMIDSRQIEFEGDVQFLRLMYAIEQLLSRVKASGGVYRLIFFDVSKRLFDAAFSKSVWAFRQAFLLHVKNIGADHAVFSDWYSPQWKSHVREWRPSFFLLGNNTVELVGEDTEYMTGFFHSLMLRCLSTKTHVAIIRGMQFRGNRFMAFTVTPDTYLGFVDKNVKTAFSAKWIQDAEEDDDDEPATGPIASGFKEFVGKLGSEAESNAAVRSYMAVRFVRSTLKLCNDENSVSVVMMKVMVKALLLHEILLRQTPLSRRAFATCGHDEWELFSEQISSALERYYSSMCKDLTQLVEEAPADVPIETHDVFDGRLYRHIFHFIIELGLGKGKGKVKSDHFGFKEYVMEELQFLWTESGAKEDFFPIAIAPLSELPGIQPPALPQEANSRTEPQLVIINSDFISTLKKGAPPNLLKQVKEDDPDTLEIKHVEITEADESTAVPNATLWKKHDWTEGNYLDAVKSEEFMEKNLGEIRMEEKFKAKGKITARDLEFMKKWHLKKKQLALKQLNMYANSLTGSNKLHPAIIMKDEKKDDDKKGDDKKDEKKKEEKLSKKHLELLEKRRLEEEQKTLDHDKNQTKQWEPKVEALADVGDLEKLETMMLDLLLGLNRVTDSFVDFPSVTAAFNTPEAQCKTVLKAIKSLRAAFKKIRIDKVTGQEQVNAKRMVKYLFCMCQECFYSFGTKCLDGKGIKQLQEALISIGFPQIAAKIFDQWKDHQAAAAEAVAQATAAAEAEKGGDKKKGGKDDKKKDEKKGKDDKKDKKEDKKDKKDKKDRKDAADDDDDDLGKYQVTKDVEKLWNGDGSLGDDEFAYQLRQMGPHMKRTVGNAKDPQKRVLFKPDKWQRDLLDIVDRNSSALIVAPTASGKTFIGYYVMDKVLRMDNESVAVYVAPSKALVNQVSAEIFARFNSKTFPPHSKNELLGVFLKEYNSAGGVVEQGKWKNCQVLVTIPHVLEMLLLSSSNQDWVKRLKYVVFDEVHCIGGEDGLQWEHNMQLIPCPFLALSATVAEPQHFYSWLSRVNAKKEQNPVEMIVHTERWNDLYKYVYRQGELEALHPFSCLMEQAVKSNGISSDMSLTPQEMDQLFVEVQKSLGKEKRWDKLCPARYFGSKFSFLSKLDARSYEKELKATFIELVRDGTLSGAKYIEMQRGLQTGSSNQASTTVKENGTCTTCTQDSNNFDESAEAPGNDNEAENDNDITKLVKRASYMQPATLYKLCRDLDGMQALPAIVFNFNRREIDRMLSRMIQELKDRQKNKYYGTEEARYRSKKIMEKRMADYQTKKTAWEQASKAKESKNQEAKANRKNAEDGERGAQKDEAAQVDEDVGDEPQEPEDLADQIDLEFSFHNPKAFGQWHKEIADIIKELKYKKIAPNLIDGIRRGIGMHHEGCKKDYRQAVEVLFRRGFLKVVFATGTLALGINMPCRSTIFCGDSLELNGLMFRQMAGRAGRRGFDLLGQVVFLDMAFLKIRSLVSSELSVLTGEFLLSPTTLLRALHMWEYVSIDIDGGADVPRGKDEIGLNISTLFSSPFFSSKTADLETQVFYHTRFVVDFLYKEGLLNTDGSTRGLANLVTHLFEIEPANFIFARLLGKGLIHEYLVRAQKHESKADRRTHLTVKLVTLLSWFLYRKRLPNHVPKDRNQRKKYLPSKDSPVLQPPPKPIAKEIMAFNASIEEHMQEFAWTVASNKKTSENDMEMPMSGKITRFNWDPRGDATTGPFDSKTAEFGKRLNKHKTKYRTRSPIAAIDGTGDYFKSPSDLVASTRNVLHLDFNSFPTIAAPMFGDAGLEPTNSWMVDFMIHGKIKYLWEDNGIGPTQAWKNISDFKEAIKKAITVMKMYAPEEPDIVIKTFQQLHDEMDKYLRGVSGQI